MIKYEDGTMAYEKSDFISDAEWERYLKEGDKPGSTFQTKKNLQVKKLKKAASFGYSCIRVLEFLNDRPFDDVAKGYIHALRPSNIRLIKNGIVKSDSVSWRVTIFLEKGFIDKIEQEVQVGLYGDVKDGHDLELRLLGEK